MKYTLNSISNIIIGHVFRSKIEYSPQGDVNLLNMDAISTTGLVYLYKDDCKKVVAKDMKDDEIIKPNDILFKAKGLTNNAVIIGSIPDNTTVTSSCHIIRIIDNRYLPEYICTWLNSIAAKKYFSMNSGQITGTTIANVSKATLEALKVPLIPLKQQKLIADIEECTKQIKELHLIIAEKRSILSQAIIKQELQKY